MNAQNHVGRGQGQLESAIMDLAEGGMEPNQIAAQLDITVSTVRHVICYMRESSSERTFHRDMALASARLLAAIAATGRGYA